MTSKDSGTLIIREMQETLNNGNFFPIHIINNSKLTAGPAECNYFAKIMTA
jgi:hypothetical protein